MPTISSIIVRHTLRQNSSGLLNLENAVEGRDGFLEANSRSRTVHVDYEVERFFNAFSITSFLRGLMGVAHSEPIEDGEITGHIFRRLQDEFLVHDAGVWSPLFDISDPRSDGHEEALRTALERVEQYVEGDEYTVVYRSES